MNPSLLKSHDWLRPIYGDLSTKIFFHKKNSAFQGDTREITVWVLLRECSNSINFSSSIHIHPQQATVISHSYLRDWFEVTTCSMVLYCVYDLSALTVYWLVHYTITVLCVVCVSQVHAAAVTTDKVLLLNTCHCSSRSTDNLNHKSYMHICMICICMRIVFAKTAFSHFLIPLCTFDKIGSTKICQIGVHIVTTSRKQYFLTEFI